MSGLLSDQLYGGVRRNPSPQTTLIPPNLPTTPRGLALGRCLRHRERRRERRFREHRQRCRERRRERRGRSLRATAPQEEHRQDDQGSVEDGRSDVGVRSSGDRVDGEIRGSDGTMVFLGVGSPPLPFAGVCFGGSGGDEDMVPGTLTCSDNGGRGRGRITFDLFWGHGLACLYCFSFPCSSWEVLRVCFSLETPEFPPEMLDGRACVPASESGRRPSGGCIKNQRMASLDESFRFEPQVLRPPRCLTPWKVWNMESADWPARSP